MPVAATQKDAQIFQHYQHLLPKSPGALVSGADNFYGHETLDIGHLHSIHEDDDYFSPLSPPILNLSPHLSSPDRTSPNQRVSPTTRTSPSHRGSPFYDLRESTRRRSLHEGTIQMQNCAVLIPEDSDNKSESPSRKRRKTSGSYIDLTNSPSPPPSWTREVITEAARLSTRRRPTNLLRRVSVDRCSTPRARRSPGTRRRTRERNIQQARDNSPERRAFQPPHMMASQIHPASLPSNHHRTGQRPIIMEQIPVTAPVSIAPFGIPMCTGPHHIPVCTTAHIPVCSSQATWSFPACNVPLPTCNIQHIPACSLPQIPLPHHTFPPIFAHPHSIANHLPRQQHVSPPTTQFPANHNQPHHQQHHPSFHQRQDEELQMIPDHRQAYQVPLHHPHGAGNPFNSSPPVVLQEPNVHPTPHELFSPFQRHYARPRMGGRSGRLRSIPLPPPPYPGFLLHFLAMLSNPPIPHLGRDFNDEATEVENYEALLNLAERLGDAKPKGLTKPEIEQLPSYRFNKENHNSDMDQTSCVVCMCDFENRQLLRVLSCSHEFHAKCVDKWLKTNRTCPICRADATEVVQSD